jgi:DNA-binding CsgD family transcriptional regulator
MNKSERDVLRLLSEIYGAGLGEKSWREALESVSEFFGAAGAVAFDLDRAAGAIPQIHAFGVEQGPQGEYAERINAINPRMKRALTQPGCHTSFDYEALPEAAIRRHEFYDWLTRECGVKYFIGSRMLDANNLLSFISIEFTARHGHATPEDVALFRRLTPHVANAWRISRSLAQASRVDDFNMLLLESVPWGVVTLDQRGRLLSLNGPARAMLARGDGLRIERGKLRALRAADDRSLQVEIASSLRSARGEAVHAGGPIAVGRRDDAVPYALRVLPLRHVVGLLPDAVPYVSVFIADPVRPALPSRDDLMAIFGFTAREAELVLLLAQGATLANASGSMRISPNTARTHLAGAMHKTGSPSQAALVGLVRGVPGNERT